MLSDQSRTTCPPSESEGKLLQSLEAANNLALFGAQPLGREVCASIFLNHAPLLLADPACKRRFVACLLLLDMPQLLARTVRAFDGVELSCTTLLADGVERRILSFSNGASLAIPVSEAGLDRGSRDRFAAFWSQRILEVAARAPEPWTTSLEESASSRGKPASAPVHTLERAPVVAG